MRIPDRIYPLSANLHSSTGTACQADQSTFTSKSRENCPPQSSKELTLESLPQTWDLNLLKTMNSRKAPASQDRQSPSRLSGESIIDRFRKSSTYSYEHSMRVGELAGRLAEKLGPSLGMGTNLEAYYNDLGKFHDIGKYSIPFEILEKPGRLTAEELNVIRAHPVAGETMLKQNSGFEGLLPAVRHHHERWDGTGYPDRLKGEEIPLEARIISVVDSFDAIISDRPYRKGSTADKAIEELRRCAGTQFDPSIVSTFSQLVEEMELKPAV